MWDFGDGTPPVEVYERSALGLEHVPEVSESERARAKALRDGGAAFQYGGIEGFRLFEDQPAQPKWGGSAEAASIFPAIVTRFLGAKPVEVSPE